MARSRGAVNQTREVMQMSQAILTAAQPINLDEDRLAIVVRLGVLPLALASASVVDAREWAATASVWTNPTMALKPGLKIYAGLGGGALLLLPYHTLLIVLTPGAAALSQDARDRAVDRRLAHRGSRRAEDRPLRPCSRLGKRPSREPPGLARRAVLLFPEVRMAVTCEPEPRSVSRREASRP